MQALADLWVSRWRREDAANSASAGLRPVTVVTGASRGLGLRLAVRFAAIGNPVMLVGRDAGALAEAASTVEREAKSTAIVVMADVTTPAGIAAIDDALAAHGAYCDVLINNAGIGLSGPFAGQPTQDVLRLVDLDVRALTEFTSRYLPGMLARGRGGVVNVASLAGYMPGPHQAAYYAAKAYVLALTEAVAYECRGQGVRMCVVAPGVMDTEFHATMGSQRSYYAFASRFGSPDFVARRAYLGYRLGQRVIVPGLPYRLAGLAARITPHPILLPIVAWLLKRRDLDAD